MKQNRILNLTVTFTKLSLVIFALQTNSCATNSRLDVRPGLEGLHRVVIPTDDIAAGSREAIEQADNYCKENKKSAYFFNDEQKAKAANKSTTNALVSGKDEANPEQDGKKYTVDMLFRCQ